MTRRVDVGFALAVGLSACAPALDWRDMRPADTSVVLLFPCKAESIARQVRLAEQPVQLVLHACKAGGLTWALALADMADPGKVGPALQELRASAERNLGATLAAQVLPLKVPGATPNPHSARFQIQGRLPDGQAVTEQVAVFAKGTQVFQATVLGDTLPAEAVDTFFDSLRVDP